MDTGGWIIIFMLCICSGCASKISCNFQDGLCDWSIQRNGPCSWTEATGFISLNTGNSQGSTRLIASDLHLEHDSCLTINVFERGNVMRNCIEVINVASFNNGRRSILAFTITLLRTNYNEVKIEVPASSYFGIAIEARCIWYCYLQINDIALKPGPCNSSVEFKPFTIRAYSTTFHSQEMGTVQHTSAADQISKRQTYFIIGEYAGIGVAALVVVCLFAIFVFVYKRREILKKSNDRSDVSNIAAASRVTNHPTEVNQTQNPSHRHAYSQLETLKETSLSNHYNEINLNFKCNTESVSSYNYIDFDNEANCHDTNLANGSVLKTTDRTDGKTSWPPKQHGHSENEDLTRKVNPAILNETSGGYAILNPLETGYNRSLRHETNGVPISYNSDKQTDMKYTIDHDGHYSLINDGIYMTMDNTQHIDTDANTMYLQCDC